MPIYSPTGFLDITNATLRTSNVEAENLLLSGGNIYVTSELETDATVLNLENVTRKGNVSSNTIEITNATTGIWAAGNVHASKFIGSGEYLTGIPPSAITGTLSQWSDGTNGDVYIAGGVGIANAHTLTSNTLQVGGNLYVRDTGSNVLTVDGNVVANYFEGDGSKLSGIVTDLQGVTDNGNTTTNVVQFSNVTTGLVTTANIEVGGDLKIDGLTAGKIPYVGADKFLKDSFITTTGDTTVITSNLDVTGNIFMRGDKFIVHSESKLINDAIVGIANNNTVSTTDKGIIMQNTAGNVAIIHHGTGDGFADQLTFGYTDDPLDTVTVTNDLTKELTVNILGNVITQNNLSIGGLLKINTITAAAQHSLQAVTNVGNVTSNTVQFSNAITSLTASSNIVVTGNVSAGHDTNTTSFLGRAAVGYMGQDDQASFAHVDHNDPARYAIKQTAAGPTYINTPAAGHIRFTVNDGSVGAEKMRITSAGKVGIGATSPDATLHVVGNAYVSSNLTVSGNVEVGTSNLFVDTVNSRVGIGTTSPIGLLSTVRDTVVAGVNTYQRGMFYKDGKLQITPPDLYNGYPLDGDFLTTSRYETDGNTDYTGTALGVAYDTVSGSKSALYFKTASSATSLTEKMRITGDGNVGIGTTSPSAPLDVPGGISTPGYHAQWSLSCAGLVTWTGSRLSWVHRVIAIPVEKTEFGDVGFIDMYVPASGTSIMYYNGSTNTQTTVTTNAAGFPLNAWEALWYVVTPGQSNSTVNSQYVITEYRNSLWKPNSNWLLIAFVNGDTTHEDHLKFIPTGGTFHVWTGLPFVNNWIDYGGGYNPGGYYRDGDGIVRLRGLIKDGTAATICTLPAGYRPGYRILTNGHTSTYGACRVDITTGGEVTLQHSTYSNGWVSLDGIHFKAEQ